MAIDNMPEGTIPCANCSMARIIRGERRHIVSARKYVVKKIRGPIRAKKRAPTVNEFDAAGGPWGYRLRHSPSRLGIDVFIEAGTFSNQPTPVLQGTIPDQTIYAGAMADGETYLQRHNWYNQGALYRMVAANFPAYPRVTVVDFYHLYGISAFLPDLIVKAGGLVDLSPLLLLSQNPAITSNSYTYHALLALLSSCAVSDDQRTQLATALALDTGAANILLTHGVLLHAQNGTYTAQDYSVISSTLSLFPEPVKDQLHLIVLDEAAAAAGGYGSGGIITIQMHATGPVSFGPYPSGSQLPNVAYNLQSLLTHEIGHMCDTSSFGLEANRYEAIYAAGAADPNAYLYGSIFPLPTEDIIFYFLGYCTDSTTILNEVASRGNTVLSQKLSHTIDLLPSLVPNTVPFFTTDPTSHVTTVKLVSATRAPGVALGDDGMITSVNGITFL
jgi:hypothetical protein